MSRQPANDNGLVDSSATDTRSIVGRPPKSWQRIRAGFVYTFVLVLHNIIWCDAWLIPSRRMVSSPSQWMESSTTLRMVRNIDYPEAIVLYGPDVPLETMAGLDAFLNECRDTETPVIAIGYTNNASKDHILLIQRQETSIPPNPQDLWEAIHSIEIQPRPFGGSSGFGARQLLDPLRPPLPAHVVVFCSTLDQTRAARMAGMRVISLQDNSLADAVVQDFDNLWLEDIATPGSFWLNPPHPRDDNGNKVDTVQVIADFTSRRVDNVAVNPNMVENSEEELDEEQLKAILADLAPL